MSETEVRVTISPSHPKGTPMFPIDYVIVLDNYGAGMGMRKGIRSMYLLEPMEKAPKNDENNPNPGPRHAVCSNPSIFLVGEDSKR